MLKLDQYDLKIIQTLAKNGRITKSDLAKIVHLSISPTWERVKRLKEQGIILGYKAEIDWSKIFKSSQVIVEVRLDRHTAYDMQRFEQHIESAPQVTQCYATGGGVDYFMHVQAQDIDHYQRFIDDLLNQDLGIDRYFTYIVTKTIKNSQELPEELIESDN